MHRILNPHRMNSAVLKRLFSSLMRWLHASDEHENLFSRGFGLQTPQSGVSLAVWVDTGGWRLIYRINCCVWRLIKHTVTIVRPTRECKTVVINYGELNNTLSTLLQQSVCVCMCVWVCVYLNPRATLNWNTKLSRIKKSLLISLPDTLSSAKFPLGGPNGSRKHDGWQKLLRLISFKARRWERSVNQALTHTPNCIWCSQQTPSEGVINTAVCVCMFVCVCVCQVIVFVWLPVFILTEGLWCFNSKVWS